MSSQIEQPDTAHVDVVVDLVALYRTSGLLDNVRDNAQALLIANASDGGGRKLLIDQYRTIVTLLPAAISEAFHPELAQWTTELGPDADVSSIYVAASTLSRWLDLVHSERKFLVSHKMGEFEAQMNEMKLNEHGVGLLQAAPAAAPNASPVRQVGFTPAAPAPGTGHYM